MPEPRFALDLEPGQAPEETFTLGEIVEANEGFDAAGYAGMEIGEQRLGGGGAWADYSITRVS